MKILLLQTHALHLGYLGCYGNEWVATPNIDRLATEGVVFDQHFAQSPAEHAGEEMARALKISLNAEEPLRQIDADAIHIRKAVKEKDHKFLWANLSSLAPPWSIPEDFRDLYLDEEADSEVWLNPPIGPLEDPLDLERLQNTYAAVVTHFDYQIGQLRAQLQDTWDNIAIVLTATCGLALGEHGIVGPFRAWMHEEVWHIPFIIRLPRAADAGRRVGALTQPGDAFWPLIRGEAKRIREFAYGRLRIGASEEWALRTPDWALLLPIEVPAGDPSRELQLYVKPDDRWEVNDVRQHYLELAESFEQTLREGIKRSEPEA